MQTASLPTPKPPGKLKKEIFECQVLRGLRWEYPSASLFPCKGEHISGEMDSVVYCLVRQKTFLQWTVKTPYSNPHGTTKINVDVIKEW